MRINVSQKIVDLSGNDLPMSQDGPPWRVGNVLSIALLSAGAHTLTGARAGQPVEQHEDRLRLAREIHDALTDHSNGLEDESVIVDFPIELCAALKVDVAREFGALIGGQVIPILNGST